MKNVVFSSLLILSLLRSPAFANDAEIPLSETIAVSQGTDQALADGHVDRAYCVRVLVRLADPVLNSLAENKLRKNLRGKGKRGDYAALEAFGRLLAGMAPWLELGPGDDEEGQLRAHYIKLALKGIANAVDPNGPDYMNFTKGDQPYVDTAYIAVALLRAPKQLWGNLDDEVKSNLVAALKLPRDGKNRQNNWLLFGATIQAALWKFTGECDLKPIETAIEKHLEYYKGDGAYGDGSNFHWDYYNSYVIHPLLIHVLQVCVEKNHPLGQHYPLILSRAKRYATIQERSISPEGTFPVMGRSSTYRFGAFQAMGQIALLQELPENTDPAAARAALLAVVRRMIEAPGAFDEEGFLQPGAYGHQPSLRESYISVGSPYICANGLLPLGLPADASFWKGPGKAWTQKRIWAGEDVPADHYLKE